MAPEQITLPFDPRRGARLRICKGPRAAERALFEDLDRLIEDPTADAGARPLAEPVLVVVPSVSLREHLIGRYAAHRGRAVLGLACRTLFHLAVDLVERSGPRRPLHPRLDAVLARRLAAAEPALSRPLGHLRDGFAAVATTVGDLLDAGLDRAHADALDEILAEEGPEVASRRETERARAQVRVATAVAATLDDLGVERPSNLLQRAATLLGSPAGDALEPRALLVYGFGDATGAATDLLEAALDRWRGTLYLDHPPDPADRSRPDPGVRFTRRFHERLATVADLGAEGPTPEAPEVELFRAPGAAAEVREVARRIRALVDGGAEPERVAVVARRLDPYVTPLRHHLEALGIPFSGLSKGPQSPTGRRLSGLLEMVESGGRTPVDRWLELTAHPERAAEREELRLALFQLGAGRLDEAAAIEVARHLDRNGRYPLPVRLGFARSEETAADDEPTARRVARRKIDGERLEAAIAAAVAVTARLERLAAARELGTAARELVRLGLEELGWSPERGAGAALIAGLEAAAEGLPSDLPLTAVELARLLEPAFDRAGSVPLGGAGAGVQVLDVIEARGRTFEHLFLVGLDRGEFPRTVREDPALPDALRRVLGRSGFGPLPDLPLKLSGFDEERYLFAQLVASAPRVTLSWQEFDDEGARRTVSPLVERLRWTGSDDRPANADAPPLARALFAAPTEADATAPRPAREGAILAGLYGDRDRFEAATALALEEAALEEAALEKAGVGGEAFEALGSVRRRIVDEIDPVFGTAEGEATRRRLGPWLGPVGPLAGTAHDRPAPVYVTHLERLAVCPWQTFLARVLRLQPLPDPLDLLPAIDPLAIGSVVHGALERLVRGSLAGDRLDLDRLAEVEPVEIERPDAAELTRLARRAAERVLRERGVALPGFARALAGVTVPYLELALALDWDRPAGPPRVLGAEVEGAVEVVDDRGRRRRVHFRADRVDSTPHGPLLTDYKTGRKELKSSPASAEKLLLQKVARGEWMQGMAYALGAGEAGARGRYLLVRPDPDTPAAARRLEVAADDSQLVASFEVAVRAALEVWDRGLLFPRLVRPDRDMRPKACRWCEVAEACVQGDSGARIRLRDWAARETEAGADDADTRALLDLWWLPADGRPSSGEER